jgi:hypothetical protein
MGNNGSSQLQTIYTLPLSIKEVLNLKHRLVFKPHGSVSPLPRYYQLRHFSLWTVPMRTAVTYFEVDCLNITFCVVRTNRLLSNPVRISGISLCVWSITFCNSAILKSCRA